MALSCPVAEEFFKPILNQHFHNYHRCYQKGKYEGKVQESIQSSITPDWRHNMGK